MNRKNLLSTLAPFALIALALFACTPAADCVSEQRSIKRGMSPLFTNPDSCYSSGKAIGKWELRWADGDVGTGNMVDGKKHGKWELRFADGRVKSLNWINGELQE